MRKVGKVEKRGKEGSKRERRGGKQGRERRRRKRIKLHFSTSPMHIQPKHQYRENSHQAVIQLCLNSCNKGKFTTSQNKSFHWQETGITRKFFPRKKPKASSLQFPLFRTNPYMWKHADTQLIFSSRREQFLFLNTRMITIYLSSLFIWKLNIATISHAMVLGYLFILFSFLSIQSLDQYVKVWFPELLLSMANLF